MALPKFLRSIFLVCLFICALAQPSVQEAFLVAMTRRDYHAAAELLSQEQGEVLAALPATTRMQVAHQLLDDGANDRPGASDALVAAVERGLFFEESKQSKLARKTGKAPARKVLPDEFSRMQSLFARTLYLLVSSHKLSAVDTLVQLGAPLHAAKGQNVSAGSLEGQGVFHAALSTTLLIQRLTISLLQNVLVYTQGDRATALKVAAGHRSFVLDLARDVAAMLPAPSDAAVLAARTLLNKQLKSRFKPDEAIQLTPQVLMQPLRVIVNGLAALILRTLLGASELAATQGRNTGVWRDGAGRTPLHIAAANGNEIAALMLLTAAPPRLTKMPVELVHAQDAGNRTALYVACAYGHVAVASLLAEAAGLDSDDPCTSVDVEPRLGQTGEEARAAPVYSDAAAVAEALQASAQLSAQGGWAAHDQPLPATTTILQLAEHFLVAGGLTNRSNHYRYGVLDADAMAAAGASQEEITATVAAAFVDYARAGRPLAVRGMGDTALVQGLRDKWTFDKLVQRVGSQQLRAGLIPYSELYGGTEFAEAQRYNITIAAATVDVKMTFEDYLLYMRHCSGTGSAAAAAAAQEVAGTVAVDSTGEAATSVGAAAAHLSEVCALMHRAQRDSAAPYYAFQAQLMSTLSQKLAADVQLVPPFLEQAVVSLNGTGGVPVPLISHENFTPKAQLFFGPAGSGAPFHVHTCAFNAIAYGRKIWFMLPPVHALFSMKALADFLAEARDCIADATACTPSMGPGFPFEHIVVIEQRAGDIVYVPGGWSHAVINTEPTVGAAVEFGTSLLPL